VLVAKWGSEGVGNKEFSYPEGIAVDKGGNVYVADYGNARIQEFTPDGQFIGKWGSFGSDLDQMNLPVSIAVSSTGQVHVAELFNQRVQLFKQFPQVSNSKAIIVAGGGPNAGDMSSLWNATQMCTNFAYRALNYQGFMRQNIRYLSANTRLDLDDDNVTDVFGKATNKNLKESITEWGKDAENLILYLSDHGGPGKFILSDAEETLLATDLALWLDAIPDTRVVLVYDACNSGSFLAPLKSSAGRGRIVISSTKPSELAFYGNLGTLSFSNFFWTQIFNGSSFGQAFSVAENAARLSMGEQQHPLVDANGDGTPNSPNDYSLLQSIPMPNEISSFNTPPTIETVSVSQTSSSTASFVAEGVTDKEGASIARVWVVIRPPGFGSTGKASTINDLPYVNLVRVKDTDRFEGSYGGFNAKDTCLLIFYAMDGMLNVSAPKTTEVIVNSPLTRKAILVGGAAKDNNLQPAIGYNVKFAYKALLRQYYAEEDIQVLSAVPDPG
jgi:hypothetical protein